MDKKGQFNKYPYDEAIEIKRNDKGFMFKRSFTQ